MKRLILSLLPMLVAVGALAQGVATLAELKGRVGVPGQCIEMKGMTGAGDGAGSYYCWDASSTETANDRTIVAVNGVSIGRWKQPTQPTGSLPIAATAVTNTLAETTLASTTVAAGMMGNNRSISFLLLCEYTTGALTTPALTITVRFGSYALSLPATTLITSSTNRLLLVRGRIINQSMTSQYGYIESVTAGGSVGAASGTSAINTAVDVPFSITATFSVLSTNATLNPKVAALNLL